MKFLYQLIIIIFSVDIIQACSVCAGAPDEPAVKAAKLGILFLSDKFNKLSINTYSKTPVLSKIENTKGIGNVIYTEYFYLFQISGLILLVAMIGSIVLTLRQRSQVKRQKISDQVNLKANNAIEKKKINLGEGV